MYMISSQARSWHKVILYRGLRKNRDSFAAGTKILDLIDISRMGAPQMPSNKSNPAKITAGIRNHEKK